MIERTITLINQRGLHARAASKLVQCASDFQSQVWLTRQGRRVNAQSIMGVLLLAAPSGSELLLEVDGPDEEQAIAALVELVDNRFGEEQ
ncbi:MAG: HPr family phosphocarrier protein [Wenzhouxiangella sp.]